MGEAASGFFYIYKSQCAKLDLVCPKSQDIENSIPKVPDIS